MISEDTPPRPISRRHPRAWGIDRARGNDQTAIGQVEAGQVRRISVISTRTTLRARAWRIFVRPCAIAFTRLEIWLDEGWIESARRDGILKTGSESLHAAEARLAIARVRLALLLAS